MESGLWEALFYTILHQQQTSKQLAVPVYDARAGFRWHVGQHATMKRNQ